MLSLLPKNREVSSSINKPSNKIQDKDLYWNEIQFIYEVHDAEESTYYQSITKLNQNNILQ